LKRATVAAKKPENWLERVKAKGHGYETNDVIGSEDQAHEMLLMGLRLSEGIDRNRYAELNGPALNSARLASLVGDGLLIEEGNRVIATSAGRLVLNIVIAELAQ
jgi:oxygen-independent coproporphyrinogen-3 oxidase